MKIPAIITVMLGLMLTSSATLSQQLVLRGDYPDPSVIKIGDTYWASATTSNWAPVFPLLQSKDLINWKTSGHVFMKLPEWADYYFWAPELSYDKGKFYVYYSAHKKGGNLCLSVASSDSPNGPFVDHGPLMCQEVGSIDAFPIRDENGKLHLIWKEDANSVGKPTPIWIAEMNEERTKLLGEKKELFRNDQPWEANLVEGLSIIKKDEYYYGFYAAAGCCGAACTYGVGVARSKHLLGPWEKNPSNPVLTSSDQWKCPGHGTPVEKDGKYYFLYHAYNDKSGIYAGRQGLLIEYRFTNDGWIEFVQTPADTMSISKLNNIVDGFDHSQLSDQWQWSVFQQPQFSLGKGTLKLSANPHISGALLGHKTLSAQYTITTKLLTKKSDAGGGVAIIGDERNNVYAVYEDKSVRVVQVKDSVEVEVFKMNMERRPKKLFIRAQVGDGYKIRFSYSLDGKNFTTLNEQDVEGAYLPPWDRAVRAGVLSKGEAGEQAVYDELKITYN